MKIKNILIGSLLTLSIALQAKPKAEVTIYIPKEICDAFVIAGTWLGVSGTMLLYMSSKRAEKDFIKVANFLSKIPHYNRVYLATGAGVAFSTVAAFKTAIELDKKDQKNIEFLTEKYGDNFFKDYSLLTNHSTCTSFSHDPYKWLKRRYNAPRYTESKVSPADVSLGGLIDQW